MTTENTNEKSQPSQIYDEYMSELRKWRHDCEMYKWMWSQHWMMHSAAMHQAFINTLPVNRAVPNSQTTPAQSNVGGIPVTPQNQAHNHVYRLPSMGRRAMAEFTDFTILFTFKMMLVWFLMTAFGLSYGNLTFQILFEEVNMDDFDSVHQDDLETMLILALVYRILACVYEWIFLWYQGATPGKQLFDLKVITCRIGLSTGMDTVSIIPATPLTPSSAWTRAMVKNLSIAFMIPSFITAFFYTHRRTSYDVLSRCIVVRATPVRRE
uniref:Protein FAM8A1-like n=1 Tax=Phallusia mammillata TaxID=59560 RepID=A0A6F9DBZ0_9ASCI|nr:protein FAM8A1-like [Phallusia mammillata]